MKWRANTFQAAAAAASVAAPSSYSDAPPPRNGPTQQAGQIIYPPLLVGWRTSIACRITHVWMFACKQSIRLSFFSLSPSGCWFQIEIPHSLQKRILSIIAVLRRIATPQTDANKRERIYFCVYVTRNKFLSELRLLSLQFQDMFLLFVIVYPYLGEEIQQARLLGPWVTGGYCISSVCCDWVNKWSYFYPALASWFFTTSLLDSNMNLQDPRNGMCNSFFL